MASYTTIAVSPALKKRLHGLKERGKRGSLTATLDYLVTLGEMMEGRMGQVISIATLPHPPDAEPVEMVMVTPVE